MPDHVLLRRIGQGSYGEVWLARNAVGCLRAVKLVYESNFESARPFAREFNGIRKFEPISRSHEGFVHVLQVGRNEQEHYFYYVMELADDASGLAAVDPAQYVPKTLALERFRTGRLPPVDCLQLGLQLSQALEHLHGNGLIHRDLKPSNIVFVKGVPKLADIGLVVELSQAQSYVGTEGFMPPEGPNSAEADVYSLGKVLYELVTGKDRHDFPEPPSHLGQGEQAGLLRELNALILKACHPDPLRRYSSARQMHEELLLLEEGKSVQRKWSGERRLRRLAVMGAIAVGCTLLACGVDWFLDWRVQTLLHQNSGLNQRLIGKVQARARNAPHTTLDLTPYYNAPLTERWYPGPTENTLSALPRGVQTLAGTLWDIRGLIQLAGGEIDSYSREKYPKQTCIAVNRWVKRMHFLQGAVGEMAEGGHIGTYQVQYASGRRLEVPIRYGSDLLGLWQPVQAAGIVPNAAVAWTGLNPAVRQRNMTMRLYQMVWENPNPADEVLALEFGSAKKNSAPLLVAITAEDQDAPAAQKTAPLKRAKVLQGRAASFQKVQPLSEGGPRPFSSITLNNGGFKFEGQYLDGFRLTVPAGAPADLVWAFRGSAAHGWNSGLSCRSKERSRSDSKTGTTRRPARPS